MSKIYDWYSNKKYTSEELSKNTKLLSNINGYSLDNNQRLAVVSNQKYTLVIAGAGSGKSLTIVGKIKYLIETNKAKEDEILCISFTNESTRSLLNSIGKSSNYNISVKTFHKLALDILRLKNKKINITPSDTLDNIIGEYFNIDIDFDDNAKYYTLEYLKFYYREPKIEEYYLRNMKQLIYSFINCYKTNNHNPKIFYRLYYRLKIKNENKSIYLILVILRIFIIYEDTLKRYRELDFNDLITNAIKTVEQEEVHLPYKYIIIDEYQDTSYLRYLLLKRIIELTSSKLMAVGDDYQSIYAFTGCNLDIFLNFKKYFGKTNIVKITNTYRCPLDIIKVANRFIIKNRKQIRKRLKTNKRVSNALNIYYYSNIIKEFEKTITTIYKEHKGKILVLGRNNKDVYMLIDNINFSISKDKIIYTKNNDIEIYYLTVHKSKGLEEENVVIINLKDDYLGFPSKIENDYILKYLNKGLDLEKEERRLFYVALTRTKNKVFLLVPRANKSKFIREIIMINKHKITFNNKETLL